MKKKLVKFFLILIAVVVLAVGGFIVYLKVAFPNVGDAPDLKVELTPERIERGHYLANYVMMCMDCHSQRNYTLYTAPLLPNTLGVGGEVFDHNMGLPGRYVAPNITPAKLSNWTDGELFRVITTGVTKDGKALFPIMPYPNFGHLDEEDIKSVIAYIRTLPSSNHEVEKSESDFPVNIIVNTIPQKANLKSKPSKSDQVKYGKYMITAASCGDCHTRQGSDGPIGDPFGGGMEFKFPDGSIVRSANITPHPDAGIGEWDEEQFVALFKAYGDSSFIAPSVEAGEFKTVMPWSLYGKMEEDDLKAIFAYLKTLSPSENTMIRFSPPE